MNNLFNDDCLNIIKNIKEDVKLVCVDLPYGETSCKWDVHIDLEEMWKQLKKVCNKQCIYLFFGSMKFGNLLINSNKKNFRYDIVWKKSKGSNPFLANKMPLRCHEFIFVFYENPGTYNPQKTIGKPYNRGTTKQNIRFLNCTKTYKSKVNTGDRFPITILSGFKVIKKQHPTQKPIDLLENLIKQYSNENDWVLDFTMGSGSCGVACKNTNRKFIGVEKNKDYFDMATSNINE